MKRFLLLVFVSCFSSVSFSQDKFDYYLWPYNDKTNKIEFSDMVQIPGVKGDSLFSYATGYLKTVFSSVNDTMLSEDTSTNIVVSKSTLHIPVKELGDKGLGYVSFRFYIRCRNNQYNYILTNFEHIAATPDGIAGGPLELETAAAGGRIFPRKYWSDYKARIYFAIQNKLDQLKEVMMNKGQI